MSNAEAVPPSGNIQVDIIIESPAWNYCEFDLHTQTQEILFITLQHVDFFRHCPGAEIALLLGGDANLQELNRNFRNIDKTTNVLSFPAQSLNPANLAVLRTSLRPFLGDIAINYERVLAESIEQNKPFRAHYTHMIVHSILHLLGYDHEQEAEAEIMENLEIQILSNLKINNPYIIN